MHLDVVTRVTDILKPLIDEKDIEIVDIAYKREGAAMVLRILLDKQDGITVNECAEINNKLGEILDNENIISERYTLEVSSPGLDRPLKDKKDFKRVLGKSIKVTTYAPIDGKHMFIGKLLGIGEDVIVIEDKNGISWEVPNNSIANAKLEINPFDFAQG